MASLPLELLICLCQRATVIKTAWMVVFFACMIGYCIAYSILASIKISLQRCIYRPINKRKPIWVP